MNKVRFVVPVVLIALGSLLLNCAAFAATSINSATPSPSVDVVSAPGKSVTFKVSGPYPIGYIDYYWHVTDPAEQITLPADKYRTRTYTITIPAGAKTNKMRVTCELRQFIYPGNYWKLMDSRTWTIRITQSSPPVWKGNYIIENGTDLNLLKSYTSIAGSLIISSNLSSVKGLEKLSSVGGILSIFGNDYLTSLAGLENLTSVGTLSVAGNGKITSLDELMGLTTVTGIVVTSKWPCTYSGVSIGSNLNLTNIQGLRNVTKTDNLDISENSSLTRLGMDALARVDGHMKIVQNGGLCNDLAWDLWDQVEARDGVELELGNGPLGDETISYIGGNKDCTTP